MIRSQIAEAQTVLNDQEVALCQRVYDGVCSMRQINTEPERQDLAARVIMLFQHGVKDEDSSMRQLI